MKRKYIQPQVKNVSIMPFRFFAVSGGEPVSSNKREHSFAKWIGSREGGGVFEDEEEEEDSLW